MQTPQTGTTNGTRWPQRTIEYLSLERNVALASATVFILGLGEDLPVEEHYASELQIGVTHEPNIEKRCVV
ncbi:MAG TPA: hypothetical protein VF251_11350, partial [Pyrinomonadaceae bacterium]